MDILGHPVTSGGATPSVHITKEFSLNHHHQHPQEPLCIDDEDLCETGSGSANSE